MEHVSVPYVWRDVAIVHSLCAVPLAAVLAVSIRRRTPPAGSLGLAALFFGVGILLFNAAGGTSPFLSLCPGVVLRAAPALGLTLSVALLAIVLVPGWQAQGGRHASHEAVVGGLGLAVLLLVP